MINKSHDSCLPMKHKKSNSWLLHQDVSTHLLLCGHICPVSRYFVDIGLQSMYFADSFIGSFIFLGILYALILEVTSI